MKLHNLLNRIFGKAEEINGNHRCETYLFRWTLLKLRKGRGLYLHHFVGNDWSRDLHDHPKRFITIGLWGWYIEETPYRGGPDWATLGYERKTYRAPWIRSFPATHQHRLTVPHKNTWTLVFVCRATRDWGFWHGGQWIQWKRYVYGDSAHIADQQRDC